MKAKEITELEDVALASDSLILVYDVNNQKVGKTAFVNAQNAIGTVQDGINFQTSIDTTVNASTENQTEVIFEEKTTGEYNNHKTYNVNVKIPTLVSLTTPTVENADTTEYPQGGKKIAIKTTNEALVPSPAPFVIENGVGISSITPKSTSLISGATNTYTINFTNGLSTDIQVVNGRAGWGIEKAYDVSQKTLIESTEENSLAKTDNIPVGAFVILTGDVENKDVGRLYIKTGDYTGIDESGTPIYENLKYKYLTDLSGAQGIQGIGIKSITEVYESSDTYESDSEETVNIDGKDVTLEKGTNLIKVEYQNESPTTATPDSTYFKVKNGKTINFAEHQEATIDFVNSTESPSISITANRDSPITEKTLSFDFKIPVAQGLSNVEVVQNETSGGESVVTFGYGDVSIVDGKKVPAHQESLKIKNGKDGYGFFTFDVDESGHLILYAEDTSKVPDFEIKDGHLFVKIQTDGTEKTERDLGRIAGNAVDIVTVNKLPEQIENSIYIVDDFCEVTEE